jgi:hypothetical protein
MSIATEYAAKATELSNRLEDAERFLQSLPSKFPARVGNLAFCRDNGEWRLRYGGRPVAEAPVSAKVLAAESLPQLIETMQREQREQLALIEAAIAAMDSLGFPRGPEQINTP